MKRIRRNFAELEEGDRIYIQRTDSKSNDYFRETEVKTITEDSVTLEDGATLPRNLNSSVYEDKGTLLLYLIPDKAKGSRWCTKWSGNIGISTKLYCVEVGAAEGKVYFDSGKYTAKIRDVITSLDNRSRIITIILRDLYTDEGYMFTISPSNSGLKEGSVRLNVDGERVVVGLNEKSINQGAYPILQEILDKKLEEQENLEKDINKLQYTLDLYKNTGKYYE